MPASVVHIFMPTADGVRSGTVLTSSATSSSCRSQVLRTAELVLCATRDPRIRTVLLGDAEMLAQRSTHVFGRVDPALHQ